MTEIKSLKNLPEIFLNQLKKQSKDEIFLTSLLKNGRSYSWNQTNIAINILANELSKFISKGDRCLLISENRPEWLISDMAIMSIGGITVPAYTSYNKEDYAYLINDCSPSVIILSNSIYFNKIQKVILKNKNIKKVFSFEELDKVDKKKYVNIDDLYKKNKTNKKNFNIFKNTKIKREDPACIIYTSGTEGNPKGVILSHGGILSNCEGAFEQLKSVLTGKITFLTWLPLSHSYEHTVQFLQIMLGSRIFYSEGVDKLLQNMQDCSPNIMTAVPRFYQGLYKKINTTFNQTTGIKKLFINKTLQLGKRQFLKNDLNFHEKFFNKFLDLIVRRKIKQQFGGKIRAFISGGGPLDRKIGIFLNSIGLPTLQGYGLTEASPIISCNSFKNINIDSVGKPFHTNQVKISVDNEIVVKGENLMLGYWNNPKETKKVLSNGWLYTGDIGKIINGFLFITDRKKDILISPGGDNISPARIENFFNNVAFINQAVVFGDNKPYLGVILVLDDRQQVSTTQLEKEILKINKKLTKVEQVKKYLLVNEIFSIENGFMTPSLKLKRQKIISKFQSEIESLY